MKPPVLATAPVAAPIILAEAKSQMVVEHAEEDTLITSMIDRAVEYAEAYTGRKLMTQTWDFFFDRFEPVLEFPMAPIQSVVEVEYYDSTDTAVPLAASEYQTDLVGYPAFLCPVNSFPATYDRPNAVRVRVTAGYADAASVPESIKQAILMLTGHLYNNREGSLVGVSASEVPMGVHAYLDIQRIITL